MTPTRELLHTRQIEMRGLRRSDGLFEIEGRLIDAKPHDFEPKSGGKTVPSGAAIHDIGLTLVFDEDLIVREVHPATRAAPYPECPAAGLAMQKLVGLSLGKGWNSAVRQLLAPVERCTHMLELLGPMATTAFQSLSALRAGQPEPVDENGRPRKIGSCLAYAPGGELVQRLWPQFAESGSSVHGG